LGRDSTYSLSCESMMRSTSCSTGASRRWRSRARARPARAALGGGAGGGDMWICKRARAGQERPPRLRPAWICGRPLLRQQCRLVAPLALCTLAQAPRGGLNAERPRAAHHRDVLRVGAAVAPGVVDDGVDDRLRRRRRRRRQRHLRRGAAALRRLLAPLPLLLLLLRGLRLLLGLLRLDVLRVLVPAHLDDRLHGRLRARGRGRSRPARSAPRARPARAPSSTPASPQRRPACGSAAGALAARIPTRTLSRRSGNRASDARHSDRRPFQPPDSASLVLSSTASSACQ